MLIRRSMGGQSEAPVEPSMVAEPIGDTEVVVEQPAPSSAFFLDQLPPAIAQGLLYIGNEDHYVRAYSTAGEAMVLARMRDVVAGLGGIDGARVHRSWWVARAAVADAIRRDRAVYLKLVDGREVPVARSAVAELKADGWL
jgi:DNA-binding LytR/AlgR family response regulator